MTLSTNLAGVEAAATGLRKLLASADLDGVGALSFADYRRTMAWWQHISAEAGHLSLV